MPSICCLLYTSAEILYSDFGFGSLREFRPCLISMQNLFANRSCSIIRYCLYNLPFLHTPETRLQPNAQPGFWAECLGFFVSCGFNILQELFLRIIEQQALVMREIRIAPEVLDKPRGKPVCGQFGSEQHQLLDVYKRQEQPFADHEGRCHARAAARTWAV